MYLGKLKFLLLSIIALKQSSAVDIEKEFEADWQDLDRRELPRWYDEAKVGIFLHWGVYSVPALGTPAEWFWHFLHYGRKKKINNYVKKNYPAGFTYPKFASMFKAEFFDPKKWADLFVRSGAKYVVLTSKHHDGYTLFPSKYSPNWNSMQLGPKRDLVKELGEAVRNRKLKYGLYYSLLEWANPLYVTDINKNTSQYTDQKLIPELKELVNKYKPSVIWSDGDWEAMDYQWKSEEILAWLYNESPVKSEVVVNDRWGLSLRGKHGDFYNYADKFNNETLQNHKWENAFSIDRFSWGYRMNMLLRHVMTPEQIIRQIVTTVSCGENRLPIHIETPTFLVSNLDSDTQPGSHWVAIHIDKNSVGQYFDSLARPPAGFHRTFLNRNCRVWDFNSKRIQNDWTSVCGEYCLMYLYYKFHGKSNVLINVGPTKEGIISPIFQERLVCMGKWLKINGEAIYETSPWVYQKDPINEDVWYTCLKKVYNARRPTEIPTPDDYVTAIYAIILKWPNNNILEVQGLFYIRHGYYRAELLGDDGKLLKWVAVNGVAQVRLPNRDKVTTKYAWTIRFTKK